MVHKYTELANKNKIFSAVSGNTDKNYTDRRRSQRAIGGALLHKGDILFIPFFWLAGNSVILLGWELKRCSPPGQLRCVQKGLWRDVNEILHRGRFLKLHSKLHLTFIYAFIPRFYSIACLSKLHSIINLFESCAWWGHRVLLYTY